MEDPTTVRDIGLELRLEAQVGDLTLRGIIDRLDLDVDGELIVNDYKTGRSPSAQRELRSMGGVEFYSFLCESVLGRRPKAIRLLYLRTGEVITATPSEQSTRFITTRTAAVWKAVERACVTEDFRPRTGALCPSCAFQRWCPAFGGDPIARRRRGADRVRSPRRRMSDAPDSGAGRPTAPAAAIHARIAAFDRRVDQQPRALAGAGRWSAGCSASPRSPATSA